METYVIVCVSLQFWLCRTELFPHYMGLLSDTDADVRGPACVALPEICRHLEAPVLAQQLRPRLIDLAQDSSDLVRELLAEHIVELAPVLGRQQTIDLLLEPLLVLLRDKAPEVCLDAWANWHPAWLRITETAWDPSG